eukprot:6109957-Pyramimonas_sp.AAC.1
MGGLATDRIKVPPCSSLGASFADCVDSTKSTRCLRGAGGPRRALPARRCVQEASRGIALVRRVRDRGS